MNELHALWTEHGFWCIQEGGVRAFLFDGTEKALLVDTTRGGPLLDFCRTLTDKPIMLVTTHGDLDHSGADEQFSEQYLHVDEVDYYKSKKPLAEHAKTLVEGDIIDTGRFCFEVVHLPGHTPGSIMLLDRTRRFALGGDTIQSGAIFMFGPGRDFPSFIKSMEKLEGYMSDIDFIYASHGELMLRPEIARDLKLGAQAYLEGKCEVSPGLDRHPEGVSTYSFGKASFYAFDPNKN